ncbi:Translation initiation factor IF2/IF5 zinc-binding [Penicillium malachiteum]|nr:Translation initiation factor IF2/IF5 zinc-binding [Penicillium malachiteum]
MDISDPASNSSLSTSTSLRNLRSPSESRKYPGGGTKRIYQPPSMADVEQKQRKSVAFSEGSVIMDTNGQVTEAPPADQPAGMQLPYLLFESPI